MDSQLDRLYRAWCAPELHLLGFRITRPFCLGTALLLEAIGSPFAQLGKSDDPIAPEDLLTALRICEEAAWPFRCVPARPSVWKAWRLRRNRKAFEAATGTFLEWLAECSGRPEFWEDENEENHGSTSAPELLSLATSLLRKLPMTEERVYTMPLGLVTWYHGTIAEQEGAGVRFAYDSDFEEENNAPDISELSEEETVALARQHLSEKQFGEWLEKRKEAQSCQA